MFPETLKLDTSQSALLDGLAEEITRLGFTLEKEGETEVRITGIPASLKPSSAADVVLKIIDSVSDEGAAYGTSDGAKGVDLKSRVALVTARAAAIKRGHRMSGAEMEHLVGELLSLPNPAHTPSGNPIFVRMPLSSFETLFS